jgi:antitoxin component YwqK of YwqJK toxin-antitoxin module
MAEQPWLIYCQNTNKYGHTDIFHEDIQGRKQGLLIGKDYKGNVSYEWTYLDNEKHGTCITYNYNGTTRRIENYKHGVLDGIYEEFYSDGSPKMRLSYINGAQFGEAQHWREKSN